MDGVLKFLQYEEVLTKGKRKRVDLEYEVRRIHSEPVPQLYMGGFPTWNKIVNWWFSIVNTNKKEYNVRRSILRTVFRLRLSWIVFKSKKE